MRLIRYLTKKEKFYILLAVAFIVTQVWLDLKTPGYMAEITTLLTKPGSTVAEVWEQGRYMLLCAFGSLATSFAVGYLGAVVAAGYAKTLRSNIFNKVNDFSMEEINAFSTASLITRTTNDITQVQMLVVLTLQMAVKAPIMAIWALSKIAGSNWKWTAATGVAMVFMLLIIAVTVKVVMPKFKMIQKYTDDVNGTMRENLTGLRVIRAFNAENFQNNKFSQVNDNLTNTNLFAQRTMAVLFPTMNLVMNVLTLSVYWIGAYVINAADIIDKLPMFSDMIVFSSYSMQAVMAFMMMGMIFIMLPRSWVSVKRIQEVLETEPNIVEGNIEEGKVADKGTVTFENVSFRYPNAGEAVLEDINFSVNKGETVAFIGSTGSGKSTLINLIPRFYDVSSGKISIDGVDVKDYKTEALYDKINYVSQSAKVFSGDIEGNIIYGQKNGVKSTKEEAVKAAKIAQAEEFITSKEDGYDSQVSQGGANLSGGQKQRLSIARAIARNAEIFIFDDSFSALDFKTEKTLRNSLLENRKDATTLIVAQRIGTIMHADKIIVLDEGKIIGQGKHSELLKNCKVYREIAKSQLSDAELEVH